MTGDQKLWLSLYIILVFNCICIVLYNYFILTKNKSPALEHLRRYVYALAIIVSITTIIILVMFVSGPRDYKFQVYLGILGLLFIGASPFYINNKMKHGKEPNKTLVISHTIAISLIVCILTWLLIDNWE